MFKPMSKAILISRPDHDLINIYFCAWCREVIEQANKNKVKVLDLVGKKATKKILTSYLLGQDPSLVFLNGHGNQSMITGFNEEPLIEENNNEQLLSEKIVYVRSCSVGSSLGESLIRNGAKAFIGYSRKFALCYSHSSQTRPLSDRIARLFLKPSNIVPISLLKGNTAEVSYIKSQNSMFRSVMYLLSSKATSEQRDAIPYLWSNRKFQVLIGNKDAKIN